MRFLFHIYEIQNPVIISVSWQYLNDVVTQIRPMTLFQKGSVLAQNAKSPDRCHRWEIK